MLKPDDNTVNISSASGKKYHHGDLRDGLIEAGMRMLESRKSEDLGLRELAREVGVSATAVYRHFPDKQALLRAIAARGFAVMGQLQAEAASGGAGRAAFMAVGEAYVRFALAYPGVFRLMFSCAPPRDLFTMPLDELSLPLRLLRGQVAATMPPGLGEAEQKIAAIRAWALVHGLAILALDGMIPADDKLISAVIHSLNTGDP
jgi:AcrR family transcriptional regulator